MSSAPTGSERLQVMSASWKDWLCSCQGLMGPKQALALPDLSLLKQHLYSVTIGTLPSPSGHLLQEFLWVRPLQSGLGQLYPIHMLLSAVWSSPHHHKPSVSQQALWESFSYTHSSFSHGSEVQPYSFWGTSSSKGGIFVLPRVI